MKPLFTLLISLIYLSVYGQQNFKIRCLADSLLAPFYHGVASGDPTSNSVILWTRLTVDTIDEPSVNWRLATDTSFTSVVVSGTSITNAEKDFCLHVDVAGLNPNTTYYYQFTFNGFHSLTGRTKTLPVGDIDSMRFAIVSCASLNAGYFNVYEILKNRNDFDAVLFLGDYIYEYESDGYGFNAAVDRPYEPEEEIVSLDAYRTRHSQYKLDEQLRELHQNFPFICIWDDHEFADNAFKYGAENHQPLSEGDWFDRVAAAEEAYFDWMPVTYSNDTTAPYKTYREFHAGDLIDLFMLDTRIDDRDKQESYFDFDWDDTSRHIISITQRNWLFNNLKTSNAQWKIIAQQVMMSPLTALGIPINDDQWDGYPSDQQIVLQFLRDSIPNNKVVLTGDIHSSWANDIATPSYAPGAMEGSAGVEFVGPSVTSPSYELGWAEDAIQAMNEHIKYIDIEHRGFLMLDVNKARVQGDYYFLNNIISIDTIYQYDDSWMVLNGSNFLIHAGEATIRPENKKIPLAPACPMAPDTSTVSVAQQNIIVLGVYPNPVLVEENFTSCTVQFSLLHDEMILFQLFDITGNKIFEKKEFYSAGLHIEQLKFQINYAGNYILELSNNRFAVTKKITAVK